ncbi:hypothetical protein HW555_009983 [Spodoptera exigua]|uniref:MADF domain-containing protein n=1 Tax=Spodoptera exigua TaxID=7107 RepID=A0A835GBG5_SPOEX|nr:hypothetical protein HW555_009983 [Spodoptera exigua]
MASVVGIDQFCILHSTNFYQHLAQDLPNFLKFGLATLVCSKLPGKPKTRINAVRRQQASINVAENIKFIKLIAQQTEALASIGRYMQEGAIAFSRFSRYAALRACECVASFVVRKCEFYVLWCESVIIYSVVRVFVNGDMATKEKEILSHIIEVYKDMPYLWNKNDKNYMNKTIRSEGFEVLLSIYKNIEKDATVKTLKKKIDNLKTNYFKELKKVKASKHTGAGSEDVYVPTIWYYDSFSFLETTTESCRSIRDTIEDEVQH